MRTTWTRTHRVLATALTAAALTVVLAAPADAASGTGLFGAPLDLDPTAYAGDTLGTSSASQALMRKLSGTPTATWFGDWNTDVQAAVAARTRAATKRHAVPVLVTYDIPDRDCGGYSNGGAPTAAKYRKWINAFAAGLRGTRAIVILEPDALAMTTCLTAGEEQARFGLLHYAVETLKKKAWVYIDAGNSAWQPAALMASRLQTAGVADAAGFSLNVANFRPTLEAIDYGTAVSKAALGAHFVIDTGRNGVASADSSWCNPTGKGLGARPTVHTASSLVDAYLWIKKPGNSDGTCKGAPSAGVWYPAYARMLARNAAF